MKIELGKFAPKAVLLILLIMTAQTVLYAGGILNRFTQTQPAQEMRRLLYSIPAKRPVWVDIVPQSDTEFYFIGTSQHLNNAANARNDARENARNQILKFYGEFISRQAIESGSMRGNSLGTLDAFIIREEEINSYAENVVSQISTDFYYTEVYINSRNQEEYIVYTLSQIKKQKAEEDIANFAKNISQRYAAMLIPASTLKSTLENFTIVALALQQNTLHRVTAYHEGAAGQVGLYGYVISKINEFNNSIEIAVIPNRVIQKPETLDTTIYFISGSIPNLGPLECKVSLLGRNIEPNYTFRSINNDNSLFLSINTANLAPGFYTVRIELLFQEITGIIGGNVIGGFSFEVTPERIQGEPGEYGYFIGTWIAALELNQSIDTYQIRLNADGRCIVKIINEVTVQDTTGNWSWDGSIFRLNAEFIKIQWVSLVSFSGINSFNILAREAANESLVRFTFFRE